MHSSLDDQLASVSKASLLGVKGDGMVEKEDSLTEQLILSARDDTVNPVMMGGRGDEDDVWGESRLSQSRANDNSSAEKRLENLIKTLRGICQERVDEGTSSYNELFDLINEDVLSGLHSLGIRKATRADAAALLARFESDDRPDEMSYKKFCMSMMLGQTNKKKKRHHHEVIEKLQWQLANCEFDGLKVLREVFQEDDVTGCGEVSREEFVSSFGEACGNIGIEMSESDVMGLMEKFSYSKRGEGGVSYVKLLSVLQGEVGSPKRGSAGYSVAQEEAGSLADRVRQRVVESGLDPMEAFLGQDATSVDNWASQADTSIPFSEVETVLSIDFGISLSRGEEIEIMNSFGIDGENVQVKSMLMSWGLWAVRNAPAKMAAAIGGGSSVASASASPSRSIMSGSVNTVSPRSQTYNSNNAYGVPGLPLEQMQRPNISFSPTPSQLQAGQEQQAGAAARQQQQQQQHATTADSMDATVLNQILDENKRLKSELATFDLDFFEELEDLKHNYNRLKTITLEGGVEGGGGGGTGGHPERDNNNNNNSSDPVDTAPHKQMADMMSRASRLEGNVGVELSPRQSLSLLHSSPSHLGGGRKKRKPQKSSSGAKYGERGDFWNSRGGVVGCSERKLAWQVSGGGRSALEEAEKWIRRMDRNGDGFLSCKQVSAAVREAGYDMTDGDMQQVLNGFGSDGHGRVDVNEFLGALEDIAGENEWYHHDHRLGELLGAGDGGGATATATETANLNLGPPRRSGEFMHGTTDTMFNGLQSGYSGAWDSFDSSKETGLVEAALREVIEQVALIDVSKLPGYGSGNRAAAILRPFRRLDGGGRGRIGLAEFGRAVEGVGLVLTAGEIRALARNFEAEPRPQRQTQRQRKRHGSRSRSRSRSPDKADRDRNDSRSPSKAPRVGGEVEYLRFVKFLLEASTMNRGVSSDNGWDSLAGGGEPPGPSGPGGSPPPTPPRRYGPPTPSRSPRGSSSRSCPSSWPPSRAAAPAGWRSNRGSSGRCSRR